MYITQINTKETPRASERLSRERPFAAPAPNSGLQMGWRSSRWLGNRRSLLGGVSPASRGASAMPRLKRPPLITAEDTGKEKE